MKAKRETMPPENDDARPDEGPPEGREEATGGDESRGAPSGAGGDLVRDPEKLVSELERLRAREEELLRALAEMTNVQRRRKLESEQTVLYAKESLVRDLLPVLDDFDRALAVMPGGPGDPVRSGIELVRERLMKILEREGVVPIRAEGQPFDPNLHDAIGERPTPPGTKPGTVLEAAQPGYMMRDRVLRHAKVIVASPLHDPHEKERKHA
jgi:molecular chaperone GrpE